ncbi:MAG TPA: LysR family transcriptional regulator [Blastocatellia bacterium]|nr:LysR family transcriptional regulator [Blastocatellia bacterium]
MRVTQLRQVDLNLLVAFIVVAEERSISAAAARLYLSQPAMSRTLQRLRAMFNDDLFIRGGSGYELTPQGQRILHELELTLPKLDRLLNGESFDPTGEEATFRIAGSDNTFSAFCPVLCSRFLPASSKISFEFTDWHEGSFEALERGRLDLALRADDGLTPSHFLTEALYEESFACVAAKENPLPKRLTLKRYLEASHLVVSTLDSEHTIIEKSLALIGAKRRSGIRMPCFAIALRCLAGTDLIVTVPNRLAEVLVRDSSLKILKPPSELRAFKYLMLWHPRINTDAAHIWLRQTFTQAGKEV